MSGQSAGRSSGPVRRRIRLAMIAVIAGATLLVTAGVARADSFDTQTNNGVTTHTAFGDCTVKVGPVQDPYVPPGSAPGTFAVIGGVTMHCQTRHYLKAYVAEYYKPTSGGAYHAVGQQQSTWYPHSFGWQEPTILETLRICGVGGPVSGWWYTRAFVAQTDIYGNVLPGGSYVESIPEWTMAKAFNADGSC